MNFSAENIKKLSTNRFVNELFVKGTLEKNYEENSNAELSAQNLFSAMETDLFTFVLKYPKLCFSDFIFMRELEILDPDVKTILVLFKYGYDCLIYLDRAVLRWASDRSDDTIKNKSRFYKKLELYIDSELKKRNIKINRFKNIKDVDLEQFKVNMAFYNSTRDLYIRNSPYDGVLVELDFFISTVLTKIQTNFSQVLFSKIIKVIKANNDFTIYLNESLKVDKYKYHFFNSSEHTVNSSDNFDHESIATNANIIIDETINTNLLNNDNQIIDNTNNQTNNGYNNINDNDDDDDEADDNKDIVDNDDMNTILHYKQIYRNVFYISFQQSKYKIKLKLFQQALLSTCGDRDPRSQFCVLLYYNSSMGHYYFMTRQVRTSCQILLHQSNELVCAWSGMSKNFTKAELLSGLKRIKNNKYEIRRLFITKIDTLQTLVDDVSHIIVNIENLNQKSSYAVSTDIINYTHDNNQYTENDIQMDTRYHNELLNKDYNMLFNFLHETNSENRNQHIFNAIDNITNNSINSNIPYDDESISIDALIKYNHSNIVNSNENMISLNNNLTRNDNAVHSNKSINCISNDNLSNSDHVNFPNVEFT